jgi:hypothetical protein
VKITGAWVKLVLDKEGHPLPQRRWLQQQADPAIGCSSSSVPRVLACRDTTLTDSLFQAMYYFTATRYTINGILLLPTPKQAAFPRSVSKNATPEAMCIQLHSIRVCWWVH